jgi:hypothetical protein
MYLERKKMLIIELNRKREVSRAKKFFFLFWFFFFFPLIG